MNAFFNLWYGVEAYGNETPHRAEALSAIWTLNHIHETPQMGRSQPWSDFEAEPTTSFTSILHGTGQIRMPILYFLTWLTTTLYNFI